MHRSLLRNAFLTILLAVVTPQFARAAENQVDARADFMRQLDEIDKLYQKGDADSADAQLERTLAAVKAAAERSPDDVTTQRALGRALAFHGDTSDALSTREAVAKMAPANADVWFELGQSQVQFDRMEDAYGSFEKAAKLDPKHAKAALMAGAMMAQRGKDDEALEWFKKSAGADPTYALAHANLGQIYQNQGKFAESLTAYQTAAKLSPDDGRVLAKVIQNLGALGKTRERDEARKAMFALHAAGKYKEPFYCREQFKSGADNVMVFEYFELEGDHALRYSFNIIPAGDAKPRYRVSLGSYDATTEMAREQKEIKEGERMFHLDGYYPTGQHETYAMYKTEPTYEETRKQVVAVLGGKLKPMAESKEPEMEK